MKHVIPFLKVQKPEIIVIHVCGNALALCRDSCVPDVVIQNFYQRRVL